MKLIYLLASVLLLVKAYPDTNNTNDTWKIIKNSPFCSCSAEFYYQQNNMDDGKVIRTGFLCPRYYYDLYDNQNIFQARGITRVLSLGFFDCNLVDIDVYNNEDYIGKISGKIFTRSRAKFVFYNDFGMEIANACLSEKTSIFLISSSNKVITNFEGQFFGDQGCLEITFNSSENSTIHPSLIKIFAAFVSDYQKSFLPKPEKETHHHHYH